MSELSILELDAEQADLLPERETLFLNFQHVSIDQHATAVAINGGSLLGARAVATNVAIVVN
jgi:hypothetical protein